MILDLTDPENARWQPREPAGAAIPDAVAFDADAGWVEVRPPAAAPAPRQGRLRRQAEPPAGTVRVHRDYDVWDLLNDVLDRKVRRHG